MNSGVGFVAAMKVSNLGFIAIINVQISVKFTISKFQDDFRT